MHRTKRVVRRGLVVFVVLAALSQAVSCSNDADPEALASLDPNESREDLGAAEAEGDVSVFSLRVGDCFDDVALVPTEVIDVPAVACDEPHDNEVFDVWQTSGEKFPGDEALNVSGLEGCIESFDAYVGVEYLESRLDIFPITPTAESWEEGDREMVCALYDIDLAKLTGSMQGSGE